MRTFRTLLLAGTALVAFAAAAAPAHAGVTWKIKGAGFGHGVGMSQYGAYGYAREGWGYRAILKHYYTGISIEPTPDKTVRVLLAPYQSAIRFSSASSACGVSLNESKTYSAERSGNAVLLRNPAGNTLKNCGGLLSAAGGSSVYLVGKGSYRGTIEARTSSIAGRLNAINAVSLDDYIKGVVPLESPASWPQEALKAQAVAARSYALAGRVGGRGFDLYDDTRSQVYGGISGEAPGGNSAVKATSLEVATYDGKIATTYFTSTSGGHTENNENVFGGSPIPYLRGVPDPHDDSSPLHRWRKSFSQAQLQGALSRYVRGKLRAIKVIRRGVSPRIVRAKLVGSGGVTKVSGLILQYNLGLYDTWAFIKKVKS